MIPYLESHVNRKTVEHMQEYAEQMEQAAGYLAERMRSLPHFRMNFKDFWEKWLSEDVDESGEGMKR